MHDLGLIRPTVNDIKHLILDILVSNKLTMTLSLLRLPWYWRRLSFKFWPDIMKTLKLMLVMMIRIRNRLIAVASFWSWHLAVRNLSVKKPTVHIVNVSTSGMILARPEIFCTLLLNWAISQVLTKYFAIYRILTFLFKVPPEVRSAIYWCLHCSST